jgi:hypothetical protein
MRAVGRFLATQTKKSDFISVLVGGGWNPVGTGPNIDTITIGGYDRD